MTNANADGLLVPEPSWPAPPDWRTPLDVWRCLNDDCVVYLCPPCVRVRRVDGRTVLVTGSMRRL